MNDRVQSAGTVTLIICALIVTGVVVSRAVRTTDAGRPAASSATAPEPLDWESIVSAGHVIGSATAPVKIVEFADFQCEYCRNALTQLREMDQNHSDEFSIVFRHFPLDIHAQAFDAAVAAECAGEQGRFVAYHDLLFAKQGLIGTAGWADFAKDAAIPDLDRFSDCLSEEWPRERVFEDIRVAERNGIRGTPAFVIPNRILVGESSVSALDRWLQEASGASSR